MHHLLIIFPWFEIQFGHLLYYSLHRSRLSELLIGNFDKSRDRRGAGFRIRGKSRGERRSCRGDEGEAWRSDTSLGVTGGARHWKQGCKLSKCRLACVWESVRWESQSIWWGVCSHRGNDGKKETTLFLITVLELTSKLQEAELSAAITHPNVTEVRVKGAVQH